MSDLQPLVEVVTRRANQPTTGGHHEHAEFSAASGQSTVSRQNIRESETPCHSGVSRAIHSSTGPRLLIGKKAPEKRVSGMTPRRNSRPKPSSDFSRAE